MTMGPKSLEFIQRQNEIQTPPNLPPFSKETIQIYRDYNISLFRDWAGAFPEGCSYHSFTDRSFIVDNQFEIKTKVITPAGYDSAKHATVIFFQGTLDQVVPPMQSLSIVQQMKQAGLDVEYVEFEGERHGFKKQENKVKALVDEIKFFNRILNIG